MSNSVTPPAGLASHTAAVTSFLCLDRRIARWAGSIACAGFILMVLLLFIGGRSTVAVGFVPEPWDKLFHAAVFATLTVLLAASQPRQLRDHTTWLGLCVLAACIVGVADELHQHFLPGRSADLNDWLADATGTALGALAWRKVVARLQAGRCQPQLKAAAQQAHCLHAHLPQLF